MSVGSKMAQQAKVLTAKPGDRSSSHRTSKMEKEPAPSDCPLTSTRVTRHSVLMYIHVHICIHIHTHMHTRTTLFEWTVPGNDA